MTIHFSSLCALIVASFAASSFAQDRGQSDILGTWTWTMPKTKCIITRTYRADGTSQVTNGQKKTEGKFSVRTDRDSGMQMVIYTVSKDGGGRNCDDESDDTTGKRYLAYFETRGSDLTMCIGPERAACLYGPYRRQ
jgi:hypothetical protein